MANDMKLQKGSSIVVFEVIDFVDSLWLNDENSKIHNEGDFHKCMKTLVTLLHSFSVKLL